MPRCVHTGRGPAAATSVTYDEVLRVEGEELVDDTDEEDEDEDDSDEDDDDDEEDDKEQTKETDDFA